MKLKREIQFLCFRARIEHLEAIAEGAMRRVILRSLAAAKVSKDERNRILTAFRTGEIRCVLATQLADEALDVPRLNRVLLTHPGKAEGRLIQQIGRALRKDPNKDDAIVYDFVDWRVSVLRRQWDKRKRIYQRDKIKVRTNRIPHWRLKIEKRARVT